MNLSMRWLQDYVDTTGIAPREYAEAMSISGSKVETYEYEGEERSRRSSSAGL